MIQFILQISFLLYFSTVSAFASSCADALNQVQQVFAELTAQRQGQSPGVGELVSVGEGGSGKFTFLGSPLNIAFAIQDVSSQEGSPVVQSFISRFLGRHVDGRGKVTVPLFLQNAVEGLVANGHVIETKHGLVDMTSVGLLPTGSNSFVQQVLAPLKNYPISVKVGEVVRFRSTKGTMKVGKVISVDGDQIQINSGDTQKVYPVGDVFSLLFSEHQSAVMTPQFDFSSIEDYAVARMRFVPPKGAALEFLNAAARLQSIPEFATLSRKEQLEILIDYYRSLIASDRRANGIVLSTLDTIDDFVETGVTACRENVAIFGTLLAEAGYSVVAVTNVPGHHIWLEVTIPGETEPYLVDLSLFVGNAVGPRAKRHGAIFLVSEVRKAAEKQTHIQQMYFASGLIRNAASPL